MKMRQLAEQIIKKSIVTVPQGSWKWQQPYVISSYSGKLTKNGKVVFDCIGCSRKYSIPQLARYGILDTIDIGGMHNKQISREYAVETIGEKQVRMIESRGWKFAE